MSAPYRRHLAPVRGVACIIASAAFFNSFADLSKRFEWSISIVPGAAPGARASGTSIPARYPRTRRSSIPSC